jgi:hypothetical protein
MYVYDTAGNLSKWHIWSKAPLDDGLWNTEACRGKWMIVFYFILNYFNDSYVII